MSISRAAAPAVVQQLLLADRHQLRRLRRRRADRPERDGQLRGAVDGARSRPAIRTRSRRRSRPTLGAALAQRARSRSGRLPAPQLPDVRQPAFLVMKDGRVGRELRAAAARRHPPAGARRCWPASPPAAAAGDSPTGPVVTAPIQVGRAAARHGRAAAAAAARHARRRRRAAVAARHAGADRRHGHRRDRDLRAGAQPAARARAGRGAARRRSARRARARARAATRSRAWPARSIAWPRTWRRGPTRCRSPIGCGARCSPTSRTSCARR